jgi:hypothetical protein
VIVWLVRLLAALSFISAFKIARWQMFFSVYSTAQSCPVLFRRGPAHRLAFWFAPVAMCAGCLLIASNLWYLFVGFSVLGVALGMHSAKRDFLARAITLLEENGASTVKTTSHEAPIKPQPTEGVMPSRKGRVVEFVALFVWSLGFYFLARYLNGKVFQENTPIWLVFLYCGFGSIFLMGTVVSWIKLFRKTSSTKGNHDDE